MTKEEEEEQEFCKKNHDYHPCPAEGCIWGYCQTCDKYYNPYFDCSKLP